MKTWLKRIRKWFLSFAEQAGKETNYQGETKEQLRQHINQAGLDIIKHYEGLKLEAYLCPGGKWTVGWGHTRGVTKGMTITIEQAEKFLIQDVQEAADAVRTLPKVSLNNNQFSALVSFVFNVGVTNFRKSTLLKMLNEGDFLKAADQFHRWVYATNPATNTKVVLKGLVSRRWAERDLFLSDLGVV